MADYGTGRGAVLLSKLGNTSDLASILLEIHNHLKSFKPVIVKLQNQLKSSTIDSQTSRQIVQLGRDYRFFLIRTMSILNKRLKNCSQNDSSELLKTISFYVSCYDVCVYSWELDSDHQTPWCQLIQCFVNCKRYKDAETEGLKIFEYFGTLEQGRIIPKPNPKTRNKKIAEKLILVVLMFLKSAGLSKTQEADYYRRLITVVDNLKPWLK